MKNDWIGHIKFVILIIIFWAGIVRIETSIISVKDHVVIGNNHLGPKYLWRLDEIIRIVEDQRIHK